MSSPIPTQDILIYCVVSSGIDLLHLRLQTSLFGCSGKASLSLHIHSSKFQREPSSELLNLYVGFCLFIFNKNKSFRRRVFNKVCKLYKMRSYNLASCYFSIPFHSLSHPKNLDVNFGITEIRNSRMLDFQFLVLMLLEINSNMSGILKICTY